MNAIERKRFLKLADFLDKLPRKKFNFGVVVKKCNCGDCGTVGCAIGWTPELFPRLVQMPKRFHSWGANLKWKGRTAVFAVIGSRLFGIPVSVAFDLFNPGHQDWLGLTTLYSDATPKQVARMMRKFLVRMDKGLIEGLPGKKR